MDDIQFVKIESGTTFYRIHKAGTKPHIFTSYNSRFDDSDRKWPRYLTIYLSDEPVGCFAEVFGRLEFFDLQKLHEYRLSEISLLKDVYLATIDHPFNLGIKGIDASHYSCPDYSNSRKFASDVFSRDLFDGIDHPLRYGMRLQLRGQTLLSRTRQNTKLIKKNYTTVITDELIELAFDLFQLEVTYELPIR